MIRIRIPDEAFQPGGPLEGHDPKKTRVPIYQSSPDGTWRLFMFVGPNGLEMSDVTFEHTFYGERRDLCEMVDKGVLVVEKDGSALSVQQIRDFQF